MTSVAVMDAAGSERAAVYAQLEAGAMAALFAATHPERTSALVLYEGMPRMSWAPDYDWACATRSARLRSRARGETGRGSTGSPRARRRNPGSARGTRSSSGSPRVPATATKFMRMTAQVDVRAVLPTIRVPTLVLHRRDDKFVDIRHSQYLAEHIPSARLVILPGEEAISFGSDTAPLLDEIEEFLTGTRSVAETERILATVMFSDIVDSTRRAAELGDRRWRDLLESVTGVVVRELTRFRGRAVKTLGDGFLATFDGPARAIRCATAIRDTTLTQFGLEVRSGLHTGEVEVIGDDVGGIAVHIGARVGSRAGAGEVLVSGTVKDLVVGSGILFEDRGEAELRGVPGTWRLWAVTA